MEKLVKRSGKVAFMDVSTTSIANFLRMTKFTEISKSKNPTEYSRTYVDEDGEVTDVTGYSEEISYAFDLYQGNLVHQKLVDITDNIELVKDVEYLINNFKTFKEVTHIEIDNGYIDLEYIKFTELAFKNMQQQIDNIQAVMLEGGTNNA